MLDLEGCWRIHFAVVTLIRKFLYNYLFIFIASKFSISLTMSSVVYILFSMQAPTILPQLLALSFDESNFSLLRSGEWLMLLAA